MAHKISKLLDDYCELKGPRYEVFLQAVAVLDYCKFQIYFRVMGKQ